MGAPRRKSLTPDTMRFARVTLPDTRARREVSFLSYLPVAASCVLRMDFFWLFCIQPTQWERASFRVLRERKDSRISLSVQPALFFMYRRRRFGICNNTLFLIRDLELCNNQDPTGPRACVTEEASCLCSYAVSTYSTRSPTSRPKPAMRTIGALHHEPVILFVDC